jgi:hypothetical protein
MKLQLIPPIIKPILLGWGISLLGLEMLFRLLPVANDSSFNSNDINQPVLTFNTKTIVHSLGWKMEQAQTRRVNNYGFVDDLNYSPDRSPVAVIGDSYIKSAMLPYQSTIQNYLSQKLTDRVPVYSYGIPGYAFSGYIGTAEYATKMFQPQAFVFLLTHGDIEDSLRIFNGSYYLDRATQRLNFTDKKSNPIAQLAKESSLFRYLSSHLKIDLLRLLYQVKEGLMASSKQTVKAVKLSDRELRDISSQLLNYLTQKSTVNPDNTIFVFDSDRESMYGEKSFGSHRDLAIFRSVAQSQGYRVINTQDMFDRYYKTTGKKLDFTPVDRHWTAETHALVTEAVLPQLSTILARQQQRQNADLVQRK